MSSTSSALHTVNPTRLRSLVWPREHGAWGMLLVPLATGAWIAHPTGDRILALLLFTVAALGLFCLRTPVEAWFELSPLRAQNAAERRTLLSFILLYVVASGAALAVLLWWRHAYGLLLLGAAAAAAFLAQAVLKRLGRETRMNAQLTGSLALTATAAGAYYLASGRLDQTAWIVWAANWLFAANQIHYVQVRIHAARATTRAEKFARGWSFLIGETLTSLLLASVWRSGWLPGLVLLAYAPLLARGAAWFLQPPRPLEIHRLGVSELVHAVVFCVLFIAAFQIQGG